MFDITVKQDLLSNALDSIKKTVNQKPATGNEYQSFVLLQTDGAGTLKLTTFDGNQGSVTYLPSTVNEYTSECNLILYDQLSVLVSTFPDTNVKIIDDPNESIVKITHAGRTKYITLSKMDYKLFNVKLPLINPICSIESSILKLIVDKAKSIVQKGQSPLDSSIEIKLANNNCIATCKNAISKTMMLYEKNIVLQNNVNLSLLVDTLSITKIIDIIDDCKQIFIGQDNNYITLQQDNNIYYIRKLNGTVADITKFMPNKYSYEFVFNKYELLTALTRIKVVSTEMKGLRLACFSIRDGFTSIATNGNRGAIEEMVVTIEETEDMNKRGNIVQFFFNVDTFINIIHLIKEDEIKICINNASNAVISSKKSNYILRILIPAYRNKTN